MPYRSRTRECGTQRKIDFAVSGIEVIKSGSKKAEKAKDVSDEGVKDLKKGKKKKKKDKNKKKKKD